MSAIIYPVCGPNSADPKLVPATAEVCRWFAVYTTSRHEKSVAEQCRRRGTDSFLPLYETVHRWKNRQNRKLQLPLFANYLFVHIPRKERIRVLEVPGVIRFVGPGSEPSPLSDFEIESLRAGLHERRVEPYPYLILGERARIVRGALAGMEGVLLRKGNNFRVVLTIAAIGQSIAVEVDAEQLEPVRPMRSVVRSCESPEKMAPNRCPYRSATA